MQQVILTTKLATAIKRTTSCIIIDNSSLGYNFAILHVKPVLYWVECVLPQKLFTFSCEQTRLPLPLRDRIKEYLCKYIFIIEDCTMIPYYPNLFDDSKHFLDIYMLPHQ